MQCNVALAIKRAIKDSPCDKLHQELELKYLYKKKMRESTVFAPQVPFKQAVITYSEAVTGGVL